jgi:hypothetical protein
MPDLQPELEGSSLPFRELHEAIFGSNGKLEQPRYTSSTYATDSITDTGVARVRKNSGCSINFLNSFLNLGLAPTLEYGMMAPAPSNTFYDPMISGDSGGRLLRSNGDLTAPSISAPGSSPAMLPEDLFQLQNALRSGQAPNAAAVEAMAARLTSTLSPVELDLLLQNVASQKKDVDYFGNGSDLAALLFPSTGGTNDASVNPMELLSCLPPGAEQYHIFPDTYNDTAQPFA